MNRKIYHSFKNAHEKALPGTYAVLYKMVEQAATEAVYLWEVDDQIWNNIGKFTESQNDKHHVIQEHVQSLTCIAPVIFLVKKHEKLAVANEAKSHDRSIKR